MKVKVLVKFIKLFFYQGLFKGLIIGVSAAVSLYGLTSYPFYSIGFGAFVSLFFIPAIWRAYLIKRYFAIIRRIIFVIVIGSILAVNYAFEAGINPTIEIDFSWTFFLAITLTTLIIWTIYILLKEYFDQSKIYIFVSKKIKDLQKIGLLPKDKKI